MRVLAGDDHVLARGHGISLDVARGHAGDAAHDRHRRGEIAAIALARLEHELGHEVPPGVRVSRLKRISAVGIQPRLDRSGAVEVVVAALHDAGDQLVDAGVDPVGQQKAGLERVCVVRILVRLRRNRRRADLRPGLPAGQGIAVARLHAARQEQFADGIVVDRRVERHVERLQPPGHEQGARALGEHLHLHAHGHERLVAVHAEHPRPHRAPRKIIEQVSRLRIIVHPRIAGVRPPDRSPQQHVGIRGHAHDRLRIRIRRAAQQRHDLALHFGGVVVSLRADRVGNALLGKPKVILEHRANRLRRALQRLPRQAARGHQQKRQPDDHRRRRQHAPCARVARHFAREGKRRHRRHQSRRRRQKRHLLRGRIAADEDREEDQQRKRRAPAPEQKRKVRRAQQRRRDRRKHRARLRRRLRAGRQIRTHQRRQPVAQCRQCAGIGPKARAAQRGCQNRRDHRQRSRTRRQRPQQHRRGRRQPDPRAADRKAKSLRQHTGRGPCHRQRKHRRDDNPNQTTPLVHTAPLCPIAGCAYGAPGRAGSVLRQNPRRPGAPDSLPGPQALLRLTAP